jgi:hypothetical protein
MAIQTIKYIEQIKKKKLRTLGMKNAYLNNAIIE